ncbi:hypothetical protein Tco_0908700 [Tanacetum coccineum]|uniref:CCHC-type domain-containing protein n=1 Tax=Tanacetum coccineum TaxID=301880 RepID=A0ABQ5CMW5_9ASTR
MFSLVWIMPPRVMRTRSAGRPAAESLERGTGVRVGRGGRGRRPRESNNERFEDLIVLVSLEMPKVRIELWNHAMSGCHDWLTDRFHELARNGGPNDLQKAVHSFSALTDEAVRNGSIKKVEKRGNVGEPSKDKSRRDDNKRTRIECFSTLLGYLAKECRGVPRNVNPINARNPIVRACYECGSTDHVRPACPRLNRARGPKENRPKQV